MNIILIGSGQSINGIRFLPINAIKISINSTYKRFETDINCTVENHISRNEHWPQPRPCIVKYSPDVNYPDHCYALKGKRYPYNMEGEDGFACALSGLFALHVVSVFGYQEKIPLSIYLMGYDHGGKRWDDPPQAKVSAYYSYKGKDSPDALYKPFLDYGHKIFTVNGTGRLPFPDIKCDSLELSGDAGGYVDALYDFQKWLSLKSVNHAG